jgi:hypothetical protein
MKKYILFCFDQYYPAGGIGDYAGSWDNLADAIAEAEKRGDDYREIYDRDTLKEVWSA